MTFQSISRIRIPVCVGLLILVASFATADDPELEPSVRHQITGLFSPDREQDLRETIMTLPGITLVKIDYAKAEATFKYNSSEVFPNAKQPGQAVKHFNDLLRQASRATFGVKPLCDIPRDQLQLVKIPVVGLDCKGCSLAAYEAVYRLEGVEQAAASFREGLVTAWIHPKETDRATLVDALKKRKVKINSM